MARKQLRDSTRTYNPLQKRKKIKEYLKTEEFGAQPVNVAFYTGLKHNTVKSLMIRMAREGEIKKLENPKGFYSSVENDEHSIFSWNFHNLILISILDDLDIEEDITDKNIPNEIVNYELLICKETKKATFRLNTDFPQNFLAIIPVIWLFQKLVLLKTGIEPQLDNVIINTIEFNQDDEKLRIDGANAISYTELMNQIKLYNKRQGSRKEIKATASFTAGTIFELLHVRSIALQNARSNSEFLDEIRGIRKQLKDAKKVNSELFEYLKRDRIKNS